MKEITCIECGDVIQSGYAVNPENSAICETCYREKVKEIEDNI
jgi:hypothetical protein